MTRKEWLERITPQQAKRYNEWAYDENGDPKYFAVSVYDYNQNPSKYELWELYNGVGVGAQYLTGEAGYQYFVEQQKIKYPEPSKFMDIISTYNPFRHVVKDDKLSNTLLFVLLVGGISFLIYKKYYK